MTFAATPKAPRELHRLSQASRSLPEQVVHLTAQFGNGQSKCGYGVHRLRAAGTPDVLPRVGDSDRRRQGVRELANSFHASGRL